MKRSKRYNKVLKKIDNKHYQFDEAINFLVKNLDEGNKDQSVDIAVNLNVDTRHADQQLRGALTLPHGGFKTLKVLVLSDDVNVDEFIELGATYVGKEDYLEKIQKGWLDFDVMITSPDNMRDLAKFGRQLGPKGLMPNPKVGTVSPNLKAALTDVVKGRANYRTDKGGTLHVQIGKTKMDSVKIVENYDHFISQILRMRPASVKGKFIKSIYLSTTQSPSLQIHHEIK